MADDADVLKRLVLQAGSDVSDNPGDPRYEPRGERDHAGRDARQARRQQQAERQEDESLSRDIHQELDGMRRHVARRPVDGGELEGSRECRIDGHQHRKPEPLPDHDLAAPDGPSKHRQKQTAFHLGRDQRPRHHRRAQREDAAEHERDDDQQLGRQQRNLVGRKRSAVAAGHCRDLVEAPRGKPDHEQGQNEKREEQPPARGFLDRQTRDDEKRRHYFSWSSSVWWRGATSYTRPPMATIEDTSSGTRPASRLAKVRLSPSSSSRPKPDSLFLSAWVRPVTRTRTVVPLSRSSIVPDAMTRPWSTTATRSQ